MQNHLGHPQQLSRNANRARILELYTLSLNPHQHCLFFGLFCDDKKQDIYEVKEFLGSKRVKQVKMGLGGY